jgi:hypothetical protein
MRPASPRRARGARSATFVVWALAALGAAACRMPDPLPVDEPCPTLPLVAGQLEVGPATCADQRFGSGGEGTADDWFLANSRLRAILRHPAAAATLAGLGGGTVLDAAPWGRSDPLYEATPLVSGGWLRVDDLHVDASPDEVRLTLDGALRSLPGRTLSIEGERHSVTWTLAVDEPWLRFDGADGLWIHPDTDVELVDGWLVAGNVVIGHDGVLAEDLGGALRVEAARGLLIATTAEAWAERPAPLREVQGTAEGADVVRLYRGDATVAVIPVDGGVFSATVPADVTSARAFAPGRAPSPRVDLGDAPSVNLPLGPAGALQLQLGWDGARPRPVRVRFDDGDARSGSALVQPDGNRLALGAGAWDLTLSAGPTVQPRALRVEVPADTAVPVDVRLEGTFDPGSRILAALDWPGARHRAVRDGPADRAREALLDGIDYAVLVALDDVAAAGVWADDAPWLRVEAGMTLTHPDGWTVTGWPAPSVNGLSGHGAPRVDGLDPADALATLDGAVGDELSVDLAWLTAWGGDPLQLTPRPDRVQLGPPGPPPFDAWSPWFAWLDAWRFLLPSGPRVWLDVLTRDRYASVEIDRALHFGRLSAGTGGWLWLTVDGALPGSALGAPPTPEPRDSGAADAEPARAVHLSAHRGGVWLDRVTLWSSTGALWEGELGDGPLELDLTVVPTSWVIAVAWSTRTDDWAVTAPIFTQPGAVVDRPSP